MIYKMFYIMHYISYMLNEIFNTLYNIYDICYKYPIYELNSIQLFHACLVNSQNYYTTRYIVSNDIFSTMSRGCIDYACH